jgi:Plasmid recombination enzyme
MEGSYQFIHVEAYAREGSSQTKTIVKKNGDKVATTKKKWSARDIFSEQWRLEGDCNHVQDPRKPGLLYGVPPMEILPIIDEWAEQTQDAQGRKLRKDGHCVLVGVVSLPRAMEDQFPEFAESTLDWLKEKYGDRLKSVVVHNDESHPHLHFSVVPNIGEKFDNIHDGFKARNEAKKNNKKAGDQNLAFIEAMRAYQDDFSKKVAMSHGLTRIGPGRRRLTRSQWHKEKQQAAYFANAKNMAMVHARKGYKAGLEKAKVQAKEIILSAQKEAQSIGVKVASAFTGAINGWHSPSMKAIVTAEKLKVEAQKLQEETKKNAEATKKIADQRVATVGNQITEQLIKNKNLEKELKVAEEKISSLTTISNWYEKKFGKAPENLPKIK